MLSACLGPTESSQPLKRAGQSPTPLSQKRGLTLSSKCRLGMGMDCGYLTPVHVASALTELPHVGQPRSQSWHIDSQPSPVPTSLLHSHPHLSFAPVTLICHISGFLLAERGMEAQALSRPLSVRMESPHTGHPFTLHLSPPHRLDIGSPVEGGCGFGKVCSGTSKGQYVGVHLAVPYLCPGAQSPSPLVHRVTQRPTPQLGCPAAQFA